MTNFIPHETKIFIDQEPPLINKKVKTMIQEKNSLSTWFEKYVCNHTSNTAKLDIWNPGEL